MDRPPDGLDVDRIVREAQAVSLSGVELIAIERQRQIQKEGRTPGHDDAHVRGEMARAAACYAMPSAGRMKRGKESLPLDWPWQRGGWKPKPNDRIRELVKAGALIAAEIDRLAREEARKQ